MAWPNTPLTTYVPNTVPTIKAFDLNAFQMGINRIINGTYSLSGLTLDGAGGNVINPLSRSAKVSRNPVDSGSTLQLGEVNVGQMFSGLAYIAQDGTLIRGINVQSITPSTAAFYYKYVVTWNTQLDSSGLGRFFFAGNIANYSNIPPFTRPEITFNPLNTNPSQLEVYVSNAGLPRFTLCVGVIGA